MNIYFIKNWIQAAKDSETEILCLNKKTVWLFDVYFKDS